MNLKRLYHLYWQRLSNQQSEIFLEMSLRVRPVLHIHRTPELLRQAITDLQNKLLEQGLVSRCSGEFDKETEAAVKEFQRQNNLRVDGIVGPLTWATLCFPILSLSMDVSEDNKSFIKQMQKALAEEGLKVEADGEFNRGTDKALRRFQRRYGLRPDGVCGAMTWTVLLGQRLIPKQSIWSSGILTRQVEKLVEQILIVAAVWIGIVWNPLNIQEEELSLLAALVVAYSLTVVGPFLLEKLFPRLLASEQPLLRYAPYTLVGLLWHPILRIVSAALVRLSQVWV